MSKTSLSVVHLACLCSLSLFSVATVDAAVYSAPDPTPSAQEVLILELINRMRADPVAERDILAPAGQHPAGVPGTVDIKMFRDELSKLTPQPPLVFNLLLLESARNHSYYMIHNGLGHDEIAGKEGFTGKSPSDRTKAVGYPGGGAENAFAQARNPAYSHLGFVVDWGPGGPGGMQPGRGHRKNIMGPYREIGPAAVPNGSSISVTHNLADRRSVPRFVGGVAYIDRNHNDFYDVGEGVGDVLIESSSDKGQTKTWASGAYVLELGHQQSIVMSATWNGMRFQKEFPAGAETIKFDWVIPPAAELERADALIAAVEAIPADSKSSASQKKRRHALIELYVSSRHLSLDEPRQEKIAALSAAVAAELEAAKQVVRTGFSEEAKVFKKMLRDAMKPYKKTNAEAWFKDAELYVNAKFYVDNFERIQADKKVGVLKNLETAQSQVSSKEFTKLFGELIKQASAKI